MTVMMFVLLFLLALSIFLIIVEIFFIPGTTVFGIVGAIGAIVAILYAFKQSDTFGYWFILAGLVFFALFFFFGKNMMKNSKMNLKSELTEKVNTYNDGILNVGDKGVTITILRPNGKAMIENKKIEVYSLGAFIEKDVLVEIVKIEENKLFVHPIN